MRRRFRSATRVASLAAGLLLAASASAEVSVKQWVFRGGDAQGRTAYFAQSHRFWGSGKYPTDPAFLGKMIAMSTGKTEFVLWCSGKVDAATNEWRSAIGMSKPSKANWYQNAFYSVKIGAKASRECATELGEVHAGEKGVATVIWRHPKARIVAKFILLDRDDKLLVETTVEPRGRIKTYELKLTCYPSSMAGGYKPGLKTRDREALTARRVMKRPTKPDNKGYLTATLAKDEPWVLFYDKYYDVAHNRGEGPCAAAYSTKEVGRAQAHASNYACFLTLHYPARTRTSHLILWDFKGMTNAAAKDYMRDLEID